MYLSEKNWFKYFFIIIVLQRLFRIYYNLSVRVGEKLEKTLPGFNTIMEKVQKDYESRVAKRMKRREQELRERDLKNHSGHSDEEEEDEEEEEGDKWLKQRWGGQENIMLLLFFMLWHWCVGEFSFWYLFCLTLREFIWEKGTNTSSIIQSFISIPLNFPLMRDEVK